MDEIMLIIRNDNDLLKLYQNDNVFYGVIQCARQFELSTQEILIALIKYGYKAKEEIFNSYTDYIKNNVSPIMIKIADSPTYVQAVLNEKKW